MFENKIQFDERVFNDAATYYFIADKDILLNFFSAEQYPDAESAEICIEFPPDHQDADYVQTTMISPTKDGMDYDWAHISISDGEIKQLLEIAERALKERGEIPQDDIELD